MTPRTEAKQKAKKAPAPWHLKPYNPNDPLDIPIFLRRTLETPKQKAEREAAWNEVHQKERERQKLEHQRREALSTLLNKERTERLTRKSERWERRVLKKQQKAEKLEAVITVLAAIEAGHKTVGQIKKFTKIESTHLIKRSLRTLLKSQKIVKTPGGRVYQLFWNATATTEKTAKPKRRVRVHLPLDKA